jgi:uncharacterized membrane protein
MTTKSRVRRSEWRIPGLLILLSLIPAAAGLARLTELASGAQITDANLRFHAAPLPVTLHILAIIPYSFIGAFQFAPALRRRWPGWHRSAGKVLVGLGLLVSLTGLWMTQFYPWRAGDGETLYLLRLVFGTAMMLSIIMAVNAIRRHDFVAHGAWMIRSYAIAMGAGTQVLTHLPYFMLVGQPDELTRTVLMGAGWAINLAVAERLVHRAKSRRSDASGSLAFDNPSNLLVVAEKSPHEQISEYAEISKMADTSHRISRCCRFLADPLLSYCCPSTGVDADIPIRGIKQRGPLPSNFISTLQSDRLATKTVGASQCALPAAHMCRPSRLFTQG